MSIQVDYLLNTTQAESYGLSIKSNTWCAASHSGSVLTPNITSAFIWTYTRGTTNTTTKNAKKIQSMPNFQSTTLFDRKMFFCQWESRHNFCQFFWAHHLRVLCNYTGFGHRMTGKLTALTGLKDILNVLIWFKTRTGFPTVYTHLFVLI